MTPFHTGTLLARPLIQTIFVLVVILGSSYCQLGDVRAASSLTWSNNFNGNYTVDGTSTYPQQDFVFRKESDAVVASTSYSLALNGASTDLESHDELKNWLGASSWPWNTPQRRYGSDEDFGNVYAVGIFFNCGSDKCGYNRFIPNSDKINTTLKTGDTLVFTFTIATTDRNSFSLSATFRRIGSRAIWSNGIATDDEGHAVVEIESGETYNDLESTLRVAAPAGDSWFTFHSSVEYVNGAPTNADFGRASDSRYQDIKEALPAGYDREGSIFYGARTYTHGYWVFDSPKLMFRPNVAAMPAGTTVHSVLGLNLIHWQKGKLGTYYFRVTMRKIEFSLSWHDDLSWADGETGKLKSFVSASIDSLSGTSAIKSLPDGARTVVLGFETLAETGGQPEQLSTGGSNKPGFDFSFTSEYGTWHWGKDVFEFEPDWDAIDMLGAGESATTTLEVEAKKSNQSLKKVSLTLTLEGSGVLLEKVDSESTDSALKLKLLNLGSTGSDYCIALRVDTGANLFASVHSSVTADGTVPVIKTGNTYEVRTSGADPTITVTANAGAAGNVEVTLLSSDTDCGGLAANADPSQSASHRFGTATVSIDDQTMTENTGTGSTQFSFTVSLFPAEVLHQSFIVPLLFAHVTTDSSDFLNGTDPAFPDSLSFGPKETEKNIIIRVNWDAEDENDETFTLSISEPVGAAKIANLVTLSSVPGANVGTGTITDDDPGSSSSITINWKSGFDGTISALGGVDEFVDNQYMIAEITNRNTGQSSAFGTVAEAVNGIMLKTRTRYDNQGDHVNNGDYSGFVGITQSENRYGNDFRYGTWYETASAWTCRCYNILFVPKADAINEMLSQGDIVASTFEFVVQMSQSNTTVIDRASITVTITRLNTGVEIQWSQSAAIDSTDNPQIVRLGGNTIYPDIEGTITANFGLDPVDNSYSNGWSFEYHEFKRAEPDSFYATASETKVEAVSQFTGMESKYGDGNSQLQTSYGLWYVSADSSKFLFRPDATAINGMAAGEVVYAALKVKIGHCPATGYCGGLQDENVIDEVVAAVKITAPSEVSISDRIMGEGTGTGSTQFKFVVSLSPAAALNQSFTVPVAFVHGTTDSADYVNGREPVVSNVVFGPKDTEKSIYILVNWDAEDENDETFTLTISEPVGAAKNYGLVTLSATSGANVGTGTITDDDPGTPSTENIAINWKSGYDGTVSATGTGESLVNAQFMIAEVVSSYANDANRHSVHETRNGLVENSWSASGQLTYGENLDESKFDGFDVNDDKEEAELTDDLTYGIWYQKDTSASSYMAVHSQSCPQWCYTVLFVPNSKAILALSPGDVVNSTYVYQIFGVDGASITVTISKRAYDVDIQWNQSVLTNESGNPVLVSAGSGTTFSDIEGTISTNFGQTPSDVSLMNGWSYEYHEYAEMEPDEFHVTASEAKAEAVTQFAGMESRYGDGNIQLQAKYGLWYVSADNTKFLFRPDATEINKLNPDDVVFAALKIKIGHCPATEFCSSLQGSSLKHEVVATVRIIATTPTVVLSIAADGNKTAIEGGTASFTVTAAGGMNGNSISVVYDISQTGNFINAAEDQTSVLNFTESNGAVTAPLGIPIPYDASVTVSGSVTVTLDDTPAEYNVSASESSDTVTIHDKDILVLSISGAGSVTEAETTADFTVTASKNPGDTEIQVHYTPSTTGSFLDQSPASGSGHTSGVGVHAMMKFTDRSPAGDGSGPFTHILKIPIQDNESTDAGEQSVTVTLDPDAAGTTYQVGSDRSASVTVIDASTLPVLTLEVANNPVEFDEPTASGEIVFKISASTMPVDTYPDTVGVVEIDVNHMLSQNGDFLDTSKDIVLGVAKPAKLTFTESSGVVTADLSVPIAGDQTGEPTGSVTLTLLAADTRAYYYKLGTDTEKNSHEVKVYDNKFPELSVSIAETQFTEGEAVNVQFTVTARFNVGESLDVNFNVWESDPTDPDTDTGTNLFTVSPPTKSTLNFNGAKEQQFGIPIDDDGMKEETTRYVNVTLKSGAGYSVASDGDRASILVLDNDGTVNAPTLSISQTVGTVTEANGAVATFTVTSNIDPGASAIEVHYTVTATGGNLLPRVPAPPDPRTNKGHNSGVMESAMMEFANGGTGTGPFTYSLEIPLQDNETPNTRAQPVTVTLNDDADGTDYQVSKDSSARILVVEDNENALPFANITSQTSSVTEGQDIVFNISISPAQETDLQVSVLVSQRGDFIPWPVRKYIRVPGIGAVLKIPTVDDDTAEGEGRVTVEVMNGEFYQPGPNGSATITIKDNDSSDSPSPPLYSVVSSVITAILTEIPPTPPQGESRDAIPVLSIRAVKGIVAEGELAVFAVSASHKVDSSFPVKIKLSQFGDFIIGTMDRIVNMQTEFSETEFVVATDNDTLAEPDGRITATIQIDSGYFVNSQNTAHVIVSDDLDRKHRQTRVATALHSVLPDLLARSTARTLDIATERVTQGLTGSPSTSIELNGKSPALTALQSGGEMLNGSSTDWQSLIDDSSFTVALYPEGGETSPATVWGVGDRWDISKDGIGGQQYWDVESHSGHFGFEARVGHGMLAGLAVSVSQSEIGYGQNDSSGMSFDSKATAIHPYLGVSTSDGNSRMQIVAGYGENELELKQERYLPEVLKVHYNMIAIGGSGSVYSFGSFGGLQNLEMSVTGEAWHVRQFVDSVPGVTDNLQVDAHHVRIAVEESHDHQLGSFGSLNPSVSIGLQEDGRNEKSVFGLDVTGDFEYDTLNGLEVLSSGKSLLSGLNRAHGWEIESSLQYDSENDSKGVLFRMSRSWNNTAENAERFIWGSELNGVSSDTSDSASNQEFEAEVGYGLDVLDGSTVATPFYGYKQTDSHGIELRFGSRFATNTGIRFEFGVERDIPETGVAVQEINLTGNINW